MRYFNKVARKITIALTVTALTFGTMGFVAFTQNQTLMLATPGGPHDPDVG